MQIGTVEIKKGQEFTISYEVASWYKRIVVEDDVTVELYGNYDNEDLSPLMCKGKIKDCNVGYQVEGTVVGDNFTSLFAGNPVGSKVDTHVGEKATYYSNMYAHALAKSIVDGSAKGIKLLPEFHARKNYYVYGGELSHSYSIFNLEMDVAHHIQKVREDVVLFARVLGGRGGIAFISVDNVENPKIYYLYRIVSKSTILVETANIHEDWREDEFNKIRETFLNM